VLPSKQNQNYNVRKGDTTNGREGRFKRFRIEMEIAVIITKQPSQQGAAF